MNNKLFVGNLAYKVTEDELQTLFGQSGTVVSITIPTDRQTGQKRGFGFVEMSSQAEAEQAIKSYNGYDLQGRPLAVSISKPRERSGFGGNRY
jgi:RNA recognition motif-containing protein